MNTMLLKGYVESDRKNSLEPTDVLGITSDEPFDVLRKIFGMYRVQSYLESGLESGHGIVIKKTSSLVKYPLTEELLEELSAYKRDTAMTRQKCIDVIIHSSSRFVHYETSPEMIAMETRPRGNNFVGPRPHIDGKEFIGPRKYAIEDYEVTGSKTIGGNITGVYNYFETRKEKPDGYIEEEITKLLEIQKAILGESSIESLETTFNENAERMRKILEGTGGDWAKMLKKGMGW